MRRALFIAAFVLAGCGGDSTYAGLTRDQAAERGPQTLDDSTRTIGKQIEHLVEADADGAMGRAGGSAPAIVRFAFDKDLPRPIRSSVDGRAAWALPYELRGVGVGLHICVYEWDGGSRVIVKRDC